MTEFVIKYLPDIFPNINFTSNYVTQFDVIKRPENNIVEIAQTPQNWEHIDDFLNVNRNIQISVYERYAVKVKFTENININLIEYADNVQLITADNEVLSIFDVKVNYERKENRNLLAEIEFSKKEIDTISNILESENLKSFEDSLLNNPVKLNILEFTVNKPQFVQLAELSHSSNYYEFKFKIDEINKNIAINDKLYCHLLNNSVLRKGLNTVICYNKDTNYLYFKGTSQIIENLGVFTDEVVIDFEPEINEEQGITTTPLNFKFYTKLRPKIKINIEYSETLKRRNFIENYQYINSFDTLKCLFYVKDKDLQKLKYLNFANINDISFYDFKQNKYYKPVRNKELYTINERDSLIKLNEIEINFMFNAMTVNNFR